MKISILGVVVSSILLCSTLYFSDYLMQRSKSSSADIVIENLPSQLGDWKQIDSHGLDVSSRRVLKLDRFVKRVYENSKKQQVYLYIGYWKRQTGDHQAAKHSPRLCLPANGWTTSAVWTEGPLKIGDTDLFYRAITGSTRMSTKLFHYWFFSGETTYHQGWKALLTISFQNLLYGRSDGGIIELGSDINIALGRKESIRQAKLYMDDFALELMKEMKSLVASK